LNLSKTDLDDAFLGGLLHELGKLVLAANYPKEYGEALRRMVEQNLPAQAVEFEMFGATYADIGAYLLWLWGLPDPVTEIVARHTQPKPDSGAGPVVAVHVADALSDNESKQNVNLECLTAMGLIDQLPSWKQLQKKAESEKTRP
jgi:HD-like signal output (HDOD) protein